MNLRLSLLLIFAAFLPSAQAAVDLAALWDFSRPELSEQRFRQALEKATGDDALVLQTQIARSFGLRKDFAAAQRQLAAIEAAVKATGPEARVRWALESGRSWASATHAPDSLTPEAKQKARWHYTQALDIAREARLDALAIDAVHMFAFVDTAPQQQLEWAQQALAISLASSQPAAQRWEASIRNNLGLALHRLGRFPEALTQFELMLALREKGGNAGSVRVAKWMVAWTLRALRRGPEALQIQLQIEREAEAAGAPDPYVFEELALLYREQGDTAKAAHYERLHAQHSKR